MNRSLFIGLVGLSLGTPALTQSAPEPSRTQTVQQAFDTASAALVDERWDEAAIAFDALETRLAASAHPNLRSLAIIRIRRAEALAHLSRFAMAAQLITTALAQLPSDDASLHEDRLRGLLTLGIIAELSLDYPEAARRFRAAIAAPGPEILRMQAYRGLVQTLMFDQNAAALAAADEALAHVSRMPDDRRLVGQFNALRGRVLLNGTRLAEARDALLEGVRLLGGLTNRADASDLSARADLATVYLLLGDQNNARRYLAYTGAGRFRRGFVEPTLINPLPCGADVTPADVAVIEFSISEEGLVAHATPVYASRGSAARAFAQAVTGWSFSNAALGGIPNLFVNMVRVEMRCSQLADAVLRQPDFGHPPRGQFGRADAPVERAERPAALRRALEQAQAAEPRDALAVFDALVRLAAHAEVGPQETAELLLQALVIARRPENAAQIEPLRIAMMLLTRARMERFVRANGAPEAFSPLIDPVPLLDHPVARENVRVSNALRFLLARNLYVGDKDEEAGAMLAPVLSAAADAVEPQVRTMAVELAAQLRAASGDGPGARSTLDQRGSPGRRCPFIPPRSEGIAARSSDYPAAALRWNFAGWVMSDVTIAQDGSVAAARSTVAYPPFVFGDAASEIARRSRYAVNVTGDGMPCIARTSRIRFVIP